MNKIRQSLKKEAKNKDKRDLILTYLLEIGSIIILLLFIGLAIIGINKSSYLLIPVVLIGCLMAIILLLAITVLNVGVKKECLNIATGQKNNLKYILTYGFKNLDVTTNIWAALLLYGVIVGVVSNFPIIGSIASLVFSIYFLPNLNIYNLIILDNKNINIIDAFKESETLLKNHRVEFYGLICSFIGWHLLSIVTFGLAGVYVNPYQQISISNFYLSLKKEKLFETNSEELDNVAMIIIVAIVYIAIIVVFVCSFLVTNMGYKHNDYNPVKEIINAQDI